MTRSILPDLTTVIQPINDIADTAVAILMKRINKEETKGIYFTCHIMDGKTSVKKRTIKFIKTINDNFIINS